MKHSVKQHISEKYRIMQGIINTVMEMHPYSYPDGSFSYKYKNRYICFYFEDFKEDGFVWHDLYIGAYLDRDVCFEGINPIFETDLTLNYYHDDDIIPVLVNLVSKVMSAIDEFNRLVNDCEHNYYYKKAMLRYYQELSDTDPDMIELDNLIESIPLKLIKI